MGMKFRAAVVALSLLITTLAHAQGGGTLPIVESGSASSGVPFVIDVNGQGTAGIQFSGTWTGTIVVSGTADCDNYDSTAVKMFDPAAASASSVTSNGVWFFSVAGLCKIQIDGVDTGAADITLRALPITAANGASSGGGGGGGGTVDQGAAGVDPWLVEVASSALPSGAATAAKQDTGNTSIASIDGKIVAVDTGAVVVASSALPSGAATAAKQDTGNTSLSSIDGKITAVDTGAVVVASGSITVVQPTGTNLHTVCDSGCTPTSDKTDEGTFTAGSTTFGLAGGFFQTTATNNALTTGQMGSFQVTATRALFVNLRNGNGTEIGTSNVTPLQVSLSGTTANANAVKVDGSAVTQPVSVAATLPVSIAATVTTVPSTADEATFTAGSTAFRLTGGFFQTTATNNALTTGQMGSFQVTAQRALFTNLRNASGTELGVAAAPLQVSLANTAANATAVKTDGSAVTQPISAGVAAGNFTVVGPAASAAAKSGNPVQTGAVFNTVQPTVASGSIIESQATSRGALIVATGVDAFTVAGSVTATQGTGTNLHTVVDSVSGNVTVVQNTANALLAQVGGLGSTGVVKTGNPVRTAGVFNTTQPTVTDGQTVDGQSTARGAVIVAAGVEGLTVSNATASNFNATVVGAAASGATKAGNPIQIGGVFNTTQPTVTTGQAVESQSTARGAQIVATGTDTFNVTVNTALPAGTNAIGKLAANSGVDIGDVDVTSVIPGTGTTNLGKVQHGADPGGSGNSHDSEVGVLAMATRIDDNSFVGSTVQNNGEYTHLVTDINGSLRVTMAGVKTFKCQINSTATTSTLVTGCTTGLLGGQRFFITSIQWSSSIISTTANFMRIQSGTGGTCGTGTTVLYEGYIPAAFNSVNVMFPTPLAAQSASELCFVHAGAGTRIVGIQGYIAL